MPKKYGLPEVTKYSPMPKVKPPKEDKKPKKPLPEITVSELEGALASLTDCLSCDEGFSTREIGEHFGKHVDWAREQIRKAINDGTWEFAGNCIGISMCGRKSMTPLYRPIKKGK